MTSYLKTMLSGLRQWITAQKADWNQNDETKIDFIKNKPVEETEDDAMDMLAEMGLADPVTDEENNILTDEDRNILTIE